MRPIILLFVTACGLVAHVPGESKGDTPLQIENWYSQKVCWFSMTPRGATAPSSNWLGHIGIEPAHVQSLNVKPGDYAMHYEGCDNAFQADSQLRITGPTFISLGRPEQATPAGYRVISISARGAHPYEQVGFDDPGEDEGASSSGDDCKPAGAPAQNDRDCCSGNTTWPSDMSAAMAASKNLRTCS